MGLPDAIPRREFVTAATALGAAALAGCANLREPADADDGASDDENESGDDGDATGGDDGIPDLPRVEDPPDATYLPTHFEAMRHLDPIDAGEYEVVPMLTYPHTFWNVTDGEATTVEPTGEEDVHLMVTVRDPETGAVLPAETGLELVVGPEGEAGTPYVPWPMISQEMGFHVGDNVPLGEDGIYEVEVRVGAIEVRKTGAFAGRFEEAGRGAFTFEFDQEFRNEVVSGIEFIEEEHWGKRGAFANHVAGGHGDGGHDHDEDDDHDRDDDGDDQDDPDHDDHEGGEDDGHHDGDEAGDHHGNERWEAGEGRYRFGTYRRGPDEGELPPADRLPGELQGEPSVGDAVLATTLLDRDSRFVDGDEYYLAVSPRTPYNRSMLPMMALDYELGRDGTVVSGGSLRDTLDHELGYHYAAPLDDVADGDDLLVSVETAPTVSRHAGYETAFLETGEAELSITVP